MDDDILQNTLLGIERRGWDSLCDSTGDVFYGQLMTDDALMVLANGMVLARDGVVEALSQSPPWRRHDISDVRLVRTGTDGAALVYVGTAYGDEGGPPFVGAMTSVYVRAGDDWRLALYQQTQLPDQEN